MRVKSLLIATSLFTILLMGGCGSGNGTLADFFGWQSLGGTWRGSLSLSDGRTPDLAITFTEFDGETVHVFVEAWDGDNYINNQTDANYIWDTKHYNFVLLPFFGGPFSVDAWIDGSTSHGNVELTLGQEMVTGQFDIAYDPAG